MSRYTMIAISFSKCVISKSVFPEPRMIVPWKPEKLSMVWCTYFHFPNSTKWNTSICKISFLCVLFGLLFAGSGIWFYKEEVGHFPCNFLGLLPADEKSIFKSFLLPWFFSKILRTSAISPSVIDWFMHYLCMLCIWNDL